MSSSDQVFSDNDDEEEEDDGDDGIIVEMVDGSRKSRKASIATITHLSDLIDEIWTSVERRSNQSLVQSALDFVDLCADQWNGIGCDENARFSARSFVQVGILIPHVFSGRNSLLKDICTDLKKNYSAFVVLDVLADGKDLNEETDRIIEELCEQCNLDEIDDWPSFARKYSQRNYLKPIVLIVNSVETVELSHIVGLVLLTSSHIHELPIVLLMGASDKGINDPAQLLIYGECLHSIVVHRFQSSQNLYDVVDEFLIKICFEDNRIPLLFSPPVLRFLITQFYGVHSSFDLIAHHLKFIVFEHVRKLSSSELKTFNKAVFAKKSAAKSPFSQRHAIKRILESLVEILELGRLKTLMDVWVCISGHEWPDIFSESVNLLLGNAGTDFSEIKPIFQRIKSRFSDDADLADHLDRIERQMKVTKTCKKQQEMDNSTCRQSIVELRGRLRPRTTSTTTNPPPTFSKQLKSRILALTHYLVRKCKTNMPSPTFTYKNLRLLTTHCTPSLRNYFYEDIMKSGDIGRGFEICMVMPSNSSLKQWRTAFREIEGVHLWKCMATLMILGLVRPQLPAHVKRLTCEKKISK